MDAQYVKRTTANASGASSYEITLKKVCHCTFMNTEICPKPEKCDGLTPLCSRWKTHVSDR